MPLKQYVILRKAVEIESFAQRKLFIYDVNRAFNDPGPIFKSLDKQIETLLQNSKEKSSGGISWEKDSDWKSRLEKFQI